MSPTVQLAVMALRLVAIVVLMIVARNTWWILILGLVLLVATAWQMWSVYRHTQAGELSGPRRDT